MFQDVNRQLMRQQIEEVKRNQAKSSIKRVYQIRNECGENLD